MSATTPVLLNLQQVHTSKFNPRKHSDPEKLKELTASVSQHGVLQPILVRPNGKGPEHYEIVAGERRYRAAKAAKLPQIPALVRELNDKEVLELAIVENTKREDVDEIDEGDAYLCLVRDHEMTVEEIAAKVDKSRSYVYSRLKLAEGASPKTIEAFRLGKIPSSTALLIARIPEQKVADQALADILAGHKWDPEKRALTFREAQKHIQDTYMLRLKGAPFQPSDAELLPVAGSCNECPKRTGNQRELFDDVKSPDVCTDPVCYRKKVNAAWKLREAAAKEAGQEVITGDKAAELYPEYGQGLLAPHSGFVDLDETCQKDPKRRSWRATLGAKPCPTPMVVKAPNGRVHEIVPEREAHKAARNKGLQWAQPAPKKDAPADPHIEEAKKRKAETKIRKQVSPAAIDALIEAVPQAKYEKPLMLLLIEGAAEAVWVDAQKAIVARREIKVRDGEQPRAAIVRHAKGLQDSALDGLLLELLLCRDAAGYEDYAPLFKRACKVLDVNLKELEKPVRDETKASQKLKDAKKKASTPPPKSKTRKPSASAKSTSSSKGKKKIPQKKTRARNKTTASTATT